MKRKVGSTLIEPAKDMCTYSKVTNGNIAVEYNIMKFF